MIFAAAVTAKIVMEMRHFMVEVPTCGWIL